MTAHLYRWKTRLAALATAIVLVASVAACGSATNYSLKDSVTVKALWFSGTGDSTRQGVTEVMLTLGINDQGSTFTLDLDTERAQGAGPAWTAATWSAASVATLFSFRDPRTVDLSVEIEGAIDGPSAGGLMAAAMLSMSADMDLRPDATMTGTINPDGSIGMVGGIPAKVRAASAAGMKKMLIPAGSAVSIDPTTGTEVNVVDEGRQLGVEVVEVASLLEALAHLTGREAEFGEGYKQAPPISDQVLAAVESGARQLRSLTRRQLAVARTAGLAPEALARATRNADQGAAALRAGRSVEAYAQFSQNYYSLVSQIAGKDTVSRIQRDGSEAARRQLLQQLDELEDVGARNEGATSSLTATNIQQMVGLPDVLTWTTNPEVDLSIFRDHLNTPDTSDRGLELIAEGLAEARAEIEVSLGQVTNALMVSGANPADQADVTGALGGYTDFLKQTGDASLNYYEQVLARLDGPEAKGQHRLARHAYAVADSMRARLNGIAGDGDRSLQRQRLALSLAVSYYIATANLVVESEILRVSSSDPLERSIRITDDPGFKNAVESSTYVTGSLLEILADEGTDSSYAHWGVEWATWKTSNANGQNTDAERLEGLSMSWHASIQLLLLSSAPIQQLSRPGEQVNPG